MEAVMSLKLATVMDNLTAAYNLTEGSSTTRTWVQVGRQYGRAPGTGCIECLQGRCEQAHRRSSSMCRGL